ncbi:proton-conducting membrane transporter [Anaerotignum lactatifermentans]|uniref:Proton-conducting membrane transporter n=1 Tax=Anaerotignum lactatifermentans TaxID=160404 RepID=A0ABS2G7Z3_9FIRM|nr:proton-conducting transporter membrane subunit [Anaerotignum lactatifermentans]MBM6828324.1 proton-conducting membrane transporter [Anaerotignum lactatifermentans]MBM6877604.1 proton-conducting membrane transporter [Anaerotignum lactatifermentans]MBM6949907.1 proton-conducting membrane transporter [Anaerotignum lactatifermentans]
MGAFITILPVIFPMIAGVCLLPVKFKDRKQRERWVLTITVLNAIFALFAIYGGMAEPLTFLRFSDKLTLALDIDGLSKVFGTMVSVLWIITTIYAFEYMTHEGREDKFFAFFTMTFGVVLGIAFSSNFLTMYLFYEFLTLATLPLVMHAMDNKARYAGKMYILYMMFGASLAFIGFVFIYCYGSTIDFVPGGVLNPALVAGHEGTLQMVFVAAFFGFGVKAAVFPLYRWLPKASVAPTPVTALLHAVAVVKSGIFAIIRLTYYSFGTSFLIGTWAQNVMLVMAAITIVFGSTVALRTPHVKRRFAYSTVSNLSYIIFGIALMTPVGLAAALLHMLYHAVLKITLFFTAGAVLYKTHREYLYEMEGFGRYMPVTFIAMAITGIGLVGIPPFAGFHSKWALATAAVETGNPVAYIGIAALIISALLTALYVFYIIVRAFFPREKEYPAGYYDHVSDPNWYMKGPLIVLTIASIVLALIPGQLLDILGGVVSRLS